MKKIFNFSLIIILISFCLIGYAQTDTAYVVTKYDYFIQNGKISSKRAATNQKTYDIEGGQLTREVIYNRDTYQPDTILYYHYKSKKLYLIEIANNKEQLIGYTALTYKKKKLVSSSTYSLTNKGPKIVEQMKYKISKKGQKISIYKGGVLYEVRESFFTDNNISKTTSQIIPLKTNKTIFYNYSNGKIINEKEVISYNNAQKSDTILIKYIYKGEELNFKNYFKNGESTPSKKVRFSYYENNNKLKYESIIEGKIFTGHEMYTYKRQEIYHPKRKPQITP